MRRRPPAGLLVLGVAAVVFLALPLAGLVQRAPWSRLFHELGSGSVRTAFEHVAPGWAVNARVMGEWSDVVLTRPM